MIVKQLILGSLLFLSFSAGSPAQTPDTPPSQDQTQGPPPEGGRGPSHAAGMMQGRGGTMGQITAMNGNSLVVTRTDGTKVTVNLTDKTEFRKDRQPAKLTDFKVGDFVMVRGDENADHSVTAQVLGGRSANAGPGGPRGGQTLGEMGKDYIAGEVKAIDAPKLTVMRVDNVSQTVELNEETTLRKGRDSITMADIQPGDHVVLHGALQNNVFVPKSVVVLSPEQWERMQHSLQGAGGPGGTAPPPASANHPPQP